MYLDAYTWRLERAVIQCQAVLAHHIEPNSDINETDAINALLTILNDPDFVLAMNEAGAKRRTIPALRHTKVPTETASIARSSARGLALPPAPSLSWGAKSSYA